MSNQGSEKTVEQLKTDRTAAKRIFSRLVNSIIRTCNDTQEEMLKASFDKVTQEAEKVMEANDDVEAGFIAELEGELDTDEEVVLSEQQQADLAKTANECDTKLKEVRTLIQSTLWTKFGKVEMTTALQAAETVCEHAAAVQPDMDQEAFDFLLNHLKELVKTAKDVHCQWKRWISPNVQEEIQSKLQKMELCIPQLVSKKAYFIQAKIKEDIERLSRTPSTSNYLPPIVKLKPTTLPKFTGIKREFYRWRKDWEALQNLGEPTGSREVKKIQLLESLDERVARDLRLTTYNTAEDIFRVLENRFGNQTSIAIEIVEELQRMPAVKSHQPRKIVDLIQTVEKALQDLKDLGNTGAIKNPLVTKSIESKLPEALKKEWLVHVANERISVGLDNRFDCLLAFLKEQEGIYEQLEQLRDEEPMRKDTRPEVKHARTKSTKSDSNQAGCVVCGDGRHKRKLYFCKQFKVLKLPEKKAAVKRLGACKKCLEVHGFGSFCKPGYLCKNQSCKEENATDHHYYLCPHAEVRRRNENQKANKTVFEEEESRGHYTTKQEEFFKKLSPELAKQCKDVFSNTASKTLGTVKEHSNILTESGLKELPVIMMLLEVTANDGQRIGTIIDLASDTNYITHKAAHKLNLRSEGITLVVHGVGGMKTEVVTKRYLLKIRVRTSKDTFKSHQMVCYGLDSIADIQRHVTPRQLQNLLPDIPLNELVRPKEINLLISHREGQLAPQKVRSVGDLVLWDGPLGKVVGGAHPKLFEEFTLSAHMSKTHFARSMRAAALKYEEFISNNPEQAHKNTKDVQLHEASTSAINQDFLKWWRWDSIGAACEPRCGGCRCGNCQPGGKEMTLAEERELEVVKEGLTYVMADSHSQEPHWHAKYPWLEDPTSLPNNRTIVEATFFRTEKQLAKQPEWKAAYTSQVHDMIDRRAAIKLSKDVLNNWDGPVWYVSHLIAPNPHSLTTPVRLVWNSSQRFRGVSLNDLLMKGPDVLNQIRAVLLRFRDGSMLPWET